MERTIKNAADYSVDYITPTYPEQVYLNQIAKSAEERGEFTSILIDQPTPDVILIVPQTTLSKVQNVNPVSHNL
jgi:hypothetical protein